MKFTFHLKQMSVRSLVAGLLVGLLLATASAWALEPPKQRPVLTVSGNIQHTNREGRALFDMAMLERLPQTTFTTMTPWEKEPITFTGPLLRDVLAAVGAQGQELRAVALNDYRVAIPASDAAQYGVIVATRIAGQPISVRARGPLFIVYPFDSDRKLQNSTYYERSIWQLVALEVQ
jgi:hypothetical protein